MNVLIYDQNENFDMFFNLFKKTNGIECEFSTFIPMAKDYNLIITDIINLSHCAHIKHVPIIVIGEEPHADYQLTLMELEESVEVTHNETHDEIVKISQTWQKAHEELVPVEFKENFYKYQNCIYLKPPIFSDALLRIVHSIKTYIQPQEKITKFNQKLLENKPPKIWFKFLMNDQEGIKKFFKLMTKYDHLINSRIRDSLSLVISEFYVELLQQEIIITITFLQGVISLTFRNLDISDKVLFFIQKNADSIVVEDGVSTVNWLC